MTQPNVSVVIPCYNGAALLGETIQSVLSQTIPVLEILVIDDGSTDDSAVVAEQFGPPVRVIRQENQGESTARNRGLVEAHGDWVGFLDADDLWMPGKLAAQLQLISNNPSLLFVITGYYLFGRQTGVMTLESELAGWDSTRALLAPTVTVLPSTALVRRDCPIRFPTNTRNCEDAIYFNELCERGHFACVTEPLVGYRRHTGSQQATANNDPRGLDEFVRWAIAPGEHQPQRRQRFAEAFAILVERERWKRNWGRYWAYREVGLSVCLPGDPIPAAFRERVLPPFVYRAKDLADRVRPRRQQHQGAPA